jgi:nitrate/nitrite transport system substrate-binding protein
LQQVLTGKFADGLGKVKNVPDRADFRPHALAEHGGVDAHADEALGLPEGRRQLQADCRKGVPAHRCQEAHEDLDQKVPDGAGYAKFKIMGKEFDPAKAAAYANSFAIKKA